MPKPASGEQSFSSVSNGAGDVFVAIFSGIAEAAGESPDEPVPATGADAGPAEFSSLVSALQDSAEVERNDALIADLANQ